MACETERDALVLAQAILDAANDAVTVASGDYILKQNAYDAAKTAKDNAYAALQAAVNAATQAEQDRDAAAAALDACEMGGAPAPAKGAKK